MSKQRSNRQAINEKLIEIQNKIGKVDAKILFEQLENISIYRPLTSMYFNTLAELYFSEKRYKDVLDTLNGKENWWIPSPYAAKSAQIFSKTFSKIGDDFHANLYKNLECYLSKELNIDEKQAIDSNSNKLIKLQETFMNSPVLSSSLTNMYQNYTELWRFIEGIIFLTVEKNLLKNETTKYDISSYINEYRIFELNIGYFYEQLICDKNKIFVLIADSYNDYITYTTLAKALTLLGKQVKLIAQLVSIDVEQPILLSDTVEISLDNVENIDGYELIHPVEILYNKDSIGNNTALLIDNILKSTKDEYANLITTRDIFEFLSDTSELNMRIQCLSPYKGYTFSNFLTYGYIGKYSSYINRIYNVNYIEELSKKSDCEFSIVIPARNSAYTLQYTLQTCLEQRGMTDKDYEIIISDNSLGNYNEIHNLVQTLNDTKIKYFHTPRNLPLNRSFEFAFSKARGEMIIPIGSDDGILPWGLETLRNCMVDYQHDDVFAWHRGFFQWSKSNSNQAGKLVIPRFYKKRKYNIDRYNCIKALSTLLNNTQSLMYTVPTLYINSGFKRRYLNKIINKTGRLWDGYTQDIYMSIVNLLINEGYVFMEYPLTIAGMSDNSLGSKAVKLKSDNEALMQSQEEMYNINGFGIPVTNKYNFQPCEIDISLFYAEIFRLLENKSIYNILFPLLQSHNWKGTFKNIISKFNPCNLNYILQLNSLKDNEKNIEMKFGHKFDENIYSECLERIYKYNQNSVQTDEYYTGFNNNGLIIDARKFGVTDIYEATKLFENIVNL